MPLGTCSTGKEKRSCPQNSALIHAYLTNSHARASDCPEFAKDTVHGTLYNAHSRIHNSLLMEPTNRTPSAGDLLNDMEPS